MSKCKNVCAGTIDQLCYCLYRPREVQSRWRFQEYSSERDFTTRSLKHLDGFGLWWHWSLVLGLSQCQQSFVSMFVPILFEIYIYIYIYRGHYSKWDFLTKVISLVQPGVLELCEYETEYQWWGNIWVWMSENRVWRRMQCLATPAEICFCFLTLITH